MTRNRHSNKSSSPLVDICVLTGGRFDFLEKCLKAIDEQTFTDYVVHLFDNGTDMSEKTKHLTLFQKYNTKRSENYIGFPRAGNELFKMGKAPLIFMVTDDVFLKPDALDVLVRRMDDETIGLCGLKLLFPETSADPGRPSGKVQHIGHAFNMRGDVTHPLVGWDADHPKCCVSREVSSVTGAAFIVRRRLFNKVGGWFEGYGIGYYEDSDLCMSIRGLGKKVFIDVDAIGYHYTGATMEKLQRAAPLNVNSMIFKARWGNSGLMQWDGWMFW